ncbi:1,6-anhydro-N-acetylmuramyl-L-alanine amidase AmpD [Massilia arenosa]|uniref:1,6-anhydro-N-acetylmuramyl-L-alanine amidase AmpD n=1 Tax=Zemynaea arenosa TaxID=2561931 RepID=A0A4Y9SME2_9BURK|nr:1,6-anhydro-N-acetylmuramyl-L-alanine amidase AmpD [Massilia arenosa]TFW27835.1 1,6-anhydro-N-acetylmuramyl-L-alanine amidase AmpD [Massilia arenosa]
MTDRPPDEHDERSLISADGWYSSAHRYDSPNFDARPSGEAVTLLVIHNISLPAGQFGTPHVPDLFTNRIDFSAHATFDSLRGVQVSAHFLVRRDGRVVQFVSADQRAWHAGVSSFEGRENCNAFSVGIEVEGSDFVPFAAAQYVSLVTLARALLVRYPITAIMGHEHIAPGRKTDPGPWFDWPKFTNLLTDSHEKKPVLAHTHRPVRIVSSLAEVKLPG